MPPPSPIIHVVTDSWLAEDYEPGLVSVIVPTYNRERWIGSALDSLAEQTWPQIEIIVVDDGSTDDTAKLLAARSREQTGPRLQVMRQANAGVSAARNTGTQASRGEFIVYLDSDDLLFPRAIQNYVESLISNNAAYCFAPIDCVDAMGRLTSEPHYFYPKVEAPDFQLDCFWSVHGACYRRRVLCDAGAWNTQLRCGEDHELMWRIKSTAGLGYYLNEVQGVYRLHFIQVISCITR